MRAWLAEHGPEVAEVMLALKRFSAGAHVENWAELDEDEWLAALDLMRADDGVPIAWLPPGPIVKELVAASDHEERNRVLMAHEKEIAADGRRVLAEVTHANLAGLRSAIASAWDAWDADLTIPAQALAAAAVVAIIDEHLGFEAFSDFRKKWEPHRDVQLRRVGADGVPGGGGHVQPEHCGSARGPGAIPGLQPPHHAARPRPGAVLAC